MASLEFVSYRARHPEVRGNDVVWLDGSRRIERLPQICWADGSTWGEANLWALHHASADGKDIKTVSRSMAHVAAYAKWLELENIAWWHFPARESERCLTRYRGALVHARDSGELAPSTASQRMSTLIRFYRWLRATGLLSPDWPMWAEKQIGIKVTDPFGFEHTLNVASTNLAIPNRKVAGAFHLEDGVLPVSRASMSQIVELSKEEASEELDLMLRTGFGSGLRLGSITDLKVQTIRSASRDPVTGWFRLAVGPGARPPVATKFGVNGSVPIPSEVLDALVAYLNSTRRLKRQALAAPEHRDLVFLTRFGKPYSGDHSRAVNVEMMRLRRAGIAADIDVLRSFHFHRTRATFATELMRVALKCLPVADAISLVREACLHRNDKTTMQYVRFIETSKAMAEAADAFSEAFMGLVRGKVTTDG